ncbi:MAG: universal stress protein [Candidatus Brocadiales bacterium]|nr:universal stress protein [Candidatus Brocadiales bacterium]
MSIKIEKILLPTDFSECAQHALMYALSLATEYKAQLIVLHVVPQLNLPPEMEASAGALYDEMEEKARAKIVKLIPRRFLEKIKVQNVVVRGVPFLEIIKEAKKRNADLITIGTHGRTGLQHAVFGSVAENVARKAPCPVLIVRHPEVEFVSP